MVEVRRQADFESPKTMESIGLFGRPSCLGSFVLNEEPCGEEQLFVCF